MKWVLEALNEVIGEEQFTTEPSMKKMETEKVLATIVEQQSEDSILQCRSETIEDDILQTRSADNSPETAAKSNTGERTPEEKSAKDTESSSDEKKEDMYTAPNVGCGLCLMMYPGDDDGTETVDAAFVEEVAVPSEEAVHTEEKKEDPGDIDPDMTVKKKSVNRTAVDSGKDAAAAATTTANEDVVEAVASAETDDSGLAGTDLIPSKSGEDPPAAGSEPESGSQAAPTQKIEQSLSLKSMPTNPELCDSANQAMKEFKITALPSSWDSPALIEQSRGRDELVWKEYYEARRLLQNACDMDSKENRPAQVYKTMIRQQLEAAWRTRILGNVLLKHTYHRTNHVVLKNPSLESATVASTIFSPYLLPRAVQLCHLYQRTVGGTDFKCSWHIQFISLADGASSRAMGRDLMSYYWRPHMTDMVELCSNEYLECPTDEIGWVPIENISTEYFTPSIVRKIRKWLFGHYHSYRLFTDFDMMKYLMGTCGTVDNMNTLCGDIGHRWKATQTQAEDMKIYGELRTETVLHAKKVGCNWLEYHTRLVCSALRPLDQWYEPYDQRRMKGAWGAAVLDHRRELYPGVYDETEEERQQPWIVWNESLRGTMAGDGNRSMS